jgi:hypothetical protein
MLDLPHTTFDRALLDAALVGYQHQFDQLDAKMADIRRELGATPEHEPVAAPVQKKRVMSAAARRKIAAAQRKRWAVFQESKKARAKKRKMSPAGRKRIAEATKKRWAEFRARKAGKAGKG